VTLTATPPEGEANDAYATATCRWSFGDGSPEQEGCAISHTFLSGQADERVTLTVTTTEGTRSATHILPLERLPVSAAARGDVTGESALPPAPASNATSFRMVLLSETTEEDGELPADLASTILALDAALVVHLGGVTGADPTDAPSDDPGAAGSPASEDPWADLRERLAEPLAREGVPLVWALGPGDLARDPVVRHPSGEDGPLPLAPGSRFPTRFALTFRAVHFAVLTGSEQDGETLDWLRQTLEEAAVYESRVVLSHLPLHPFSPRERPTLGPRFKLYELLLRARVSLFASASHGVHYAARYGALPVVSVGRTAGPPATLAGQDLAQPPTLTVVDVKDGKLARVHALERSPEGRWQPLDPAYLPERVEVYTR
jgi:hypothetical protein